MDYHDLVGHPELALEVNQSSIRQGSELAVCLSTIVMERLHLVSYQRWKSENCQTSGPMARLGSSRADYQSWGWTVAHLDTKLKLKECQGLDW